MPRGDEPAFPVPEGTTVWLTGMTRRQWLVGMAMQGYIASGEFNSDFIAKWSHGDADAILEYEEKEGNK